MRNIVVGLLSQSLGLSIKPDFMKCAPSFLLSLAPQLLNLTYSNSLNASIISEGHLLLCKGL
jgi:hypothetical protein